MFNFLLVLQGFLCGREDLNLHTHASTSPSS
jgi:hypothetical protein